MTTRQDAVELLRADHQEVMGLFEAYDSLCERHASDMEKSAVTERICLLLSVRSQVEEEIFYPALRQVNIDLVALGARLRQRMSALMAVHKKARGGLGRENESADPVGRPAKG
jgi:hypothetical protein